MNNKYVTCKSCGWVHFEVSAAYTRSWEEEWMSLYLNKPQDWLDSFGICKEPPRARKQYGACQRCGESYKNFRDTKKAEIPNGSTVSPILCRKEEFLAPVREEEV